MCVCLLQEDQTAIAAFYGLAVSILGTFGFAFLISSFVVFPVQERECKVLVISSSTVRVMKLLRASSAAWVNVGLGAV